MTKAIDFESESETKLFENKTAITVSKPHLGWSYHALTEIAESSEVRHITDDIQLDFRGLGGQQVARQNARLLRVHQIQVIVRHLRLQRVLIKLIVR